MQPQDDRAKILIVDDEKVNIADHVTISVGGTICAPSLKDDSLDLVAASDRALYQAKQKGRNCIVSSDAIF